MGARREGNGSDMVDRARARKLAVRIRQIAAETLEREVKDPRLALVTLTDARVTPDLRAATLYYTVYGDDRARADSATALASATGLVRAAVGRRTGIRFTPTVAFVADVVPESARHVEELLAEAGSRDAELARLRVGATPAGEADPYRRPPEEDSADGAPGPGGAGGDAPGR